MSIKLKPVATVDSSKSVENPPGAVRTTLAYNAQAQICHFKLTAGMQIPLHNHEAVQAGYVISGKVRFSKKDDQGFTAEAGTGYTFDPNEYHGAEVLEDAEVIEFFTPMRPEYVED